MVFFVFLFFFFLFLFVEKRDDAFPYVTRDFSVINAVKEVYGVQRHEKPCKERGGGIPLDFDIGGGAQQAARQRECAEGLSDHVCLFRVLRNNNGYLVGYQKFPSVAEPFR